MIVIGLPFSSTCSANFFKSQQQLRAEPALTNIHTQLKSQVTVIAMGGPERRGFRPLPPGS